MGKKLTKHIFIEKGNIKHNNSYIYDEVIYINSKYKVLIGCKKCKNKFLQRPNDHLNGCGCPYCFGTHKYSNEEFINKANFVHNYNFNYDEVIYKGAKTHIKILCMKCKKHFLQTPNNHLNGCGCPYCNLNNKSAFEETISKILEKHKINYEREKTFEWLKYKKSLRLDFYLPKYNIAIECQGEQHFKPIKLYGGNDEYKKRVKRDEVKKILCTEHNIKILYLRRNQKNKFENIILNETTNKKEGD